jgi:hypothetical protein
MSSDPIYIQFQTLFEHFIKLYCVRSESNESNVNEYESQENYIQDEDLDIEFTESKVRRTILGTKISTNREALYGDLGRTSMYIQRILIMIKYWIKLSSL